MNHSQEPAILLVSPTPPPVHGAAIAAQMFLRTVGRRRRVEHINASFAASVAELSTGSGAKVVLMLRYWRRLVSLLRRHPGALVVITPAFYPGPFLKDALYIWTSRLMGGTVVLWCHMNAQALQWERRPRWFRSLFAATMHRAALCVTVGHKLQSAFPAPLAALPFAHVHNAVEAPAPAAEYERGAELTVLYLSNMGKQKGWDVLFRAAEELCARHPALRFVFVGAPMGDTDDGQLRAAFAASPYARRIVYRGPLYGAEKDEAFARADIFCFPSLIEAFPLTVLEAMAAGLPVVASDVGAVSEALLPEGGVLVPPGDAARLRDALDALVANPELRRSMGNFNRERHRHHFTPEAFGLAWENIFSSLRGCR